MEHGTINSGTGRRAARRLPPMPLVALMALMTCAVTKARAQEPTPISNEKELRAVADNTNGDYILTADIVCEGNWTPIGEFDGAFNGSGFTITYNIAGAANASGLFGTNYGTIRNLRVAGSISGTNTEYGGIAGINSGTIENCSSSVDVTSNYNGELAIGGIAGYNDLTIRYCAASGNISGSVSGASQVGGITGNNRHGSIGHCTFTGTLCGTSKLTGMVVGENYDGDITDCHYIDTGDNNPGGCKGVGGNDGGNDDSTTPQASLDDLAAIGSEAWTLGHYIYGAALGGVAPKADTGPDDTVTESREPASVNKKATTARRRQLR